MDSHSSSDVTKLIPLNILMILGPPPLLVSEDEGTYYEFLGQLAKDIGPRDMLAWKYIKHIADYFFEVSRYRLIKSEIAQHATDSYLNKLEADLEAQKAVDVHTVQAAAGLKITEVEKSHGSKTPEGAKRIGELEAKCKAGVAAIEKRYAQHRAGLEALGAKPCDTLALTLEEWIHPVAKIDKLLEISEESLRTAVRDLERHMSGFGQALRERVNKIIDGEVIKKDAA